MSIETLQVMEPIPKKYWQSKLLYLWFFKKYIYIILKSVHSLKWFLYMGFHSICTQGWIKNFDFYHSNMQYVHDPIGFGLWKLSQYFQKVEFFSFLIT
jgi:hypothetical protein